MNIDQRHYHRATSRRVAAGLGLSVAVLLAAGCAQPTQAGRQPSNAATSITELASSFASSPPDAPSDCVLQPPQSDPNKPGKIPEPRMEGPITFDQYSFWDIQGGKIVSDGPAPTYTFAERVRQSPIMIRGKISAVAPAISIDPKDPWSEEISPSTLFSVTSSTDGKVYRFGQLRMFSPDCVLSIKPIPTEEFIFFLQADPQGIPGANSSCDGVDCIVLANPAGSGASTPRYGTEENRGVHWWDTKPLKGIDQIWEYAQKIKSGCRLRGADKAPSSPVLDC